jgi:hypothetical protein
MDRPSIADRTDGAAFSALEIRGVFLNRHAP